MFKSPFQICDDTVGIEFRFVGVEDFKITAEYLLPVVLY